MPSSLRTISYIVAPLLALQVSDTDGDGVAGATRFDGDGSAALARLKIAEAGAEGVDATTENPPMTLFAVRVGAVAKPFPFVTTVELDANDPLAPLVPGVIVNVTEAPETG